MGKWIHRIGSFFCLIILLSLTVPDTAHAKTTANPNHKGWVGKHPKLKQVDWKPVEVKCDRCQKMVDQYNTTIAQLLKSRYWIKFWREVSNNREQGKADPFWPGKGDINEFEGAAVGANLELFELQQAQLTLHTQMVTSLEQQAQYLRQVIGECEQTACKAQKPTKIKAVKIDGLVANSPFQPDQASILKTYRVNWAGPYKTLCLPCKPIVAQINALPGWVTRAHMKLRLAEMQLKNAELINKSNTVKLSFLEYQHPDKSDYTGLTKTVKKLRAEIEALAAHFEKLKNNLSVCEQKHCSKLISDVSLGDDNLVSAAPFTQCPKPTATKKIVVGPNREVGSSANFKEKAKKKLIGTAGKAITSLLGVSGGGSKAKGPTTYRDPVKKKGKLRIRNKAQKRDISTGAVFTPTGLLVSSNIKKAPGKGTFQSIYLENDQGWRLEPIGYYLYEIWKDWKLNVSWTRDTYIDGEHVNHEEGGWTESWREDIAKGKQDVYGGVANLPIWENLGFNTAVSGARSLGTVFPVSPGMLATGPINLVIHITDPKKDPVVTVPYVLQLSLDNKGKVITEEVNETLASQGAPCETAAVQKSSSSSTNNQENLPERLGKANDSVQPTLSPSPPPTRENSTLDDSAPDTILLSSSEKANPCNNNCDKLKAIADKKKMLADQAQKKADRLKLTTKQLNNAALEAEKQASNAAEMAREKPRNDHAIINGDKYTTADTEYRIKLQADINAKHKAGEISDAEHERQTKANTVKKAQEERLKNLAALKQAAAEAAAKAKKARALAQETKSTSDQAQTDANSAKLEADKAKQAYDDCVRRVKEECEKQKAAEKKRLAEIKAAEERKAELAAKAKHQQVAEEKTRAAAERRRQIDLEERKRLMALIKKLGLINKKLSEVPSIWQWLAEPDQVPLGMLAEQVAGVPIPTDTIKAIGGLYGIIGSFLNPCTGRGMIKTDDRLKKMINPRSGKLYTANEAAIERAKMCALLTEMRGRLNSQLTK